MKKNEIEELKNKPPAELDKLLRDGRKKLHSLRFDLAAGKVKNIAEIRELKKDIARVLTFLHRRPNSEKKNE